MASRWATEVVEEQQAQVEENPLLPKVPAAVDSDDIPIAFGLRNVSATKNMEATGLEAV